MSGAEDPVALLFRFGLGPWLFPCRGKIPAVDAWNKLPLVDEARVREWLGMDFNLALRTGPGCGMVVIDNDQPKHTDCLERANGMCSHNFELPPTGLVVVSSTGSRHGYYRCPADAPHNSASKLAPHVDVRGDGGYVMVPPSIHPETHAAYQWESTGEPGTLPADVLARMTTPASTIRIDMRRTVVASGTGYADTALVREAARVRAAAPSTANDTLVRAAFSLGQLVAGGALEEGQVRSELASAAAIRNIPEREAAATIASGLRGGAKSPRTVPERTTRASVAAPEPIAVLVPGSHVLPGPPGYAEQGNHTFSLAVLASLAPDALYRRSSAVGELHDGQFVQVTPDRLRSIVDASVRLIAFKAPGRDSESDVPVEVYRTCTRDNASVLLEYASVRGSVRDLKHIARYPVCVGADFVPARPGWDADSGVFLACDRVPDPLPLDEARAVLEDLVCDFPFASDADRANYFGLLVTVLVRPAIGEPVPMHMIGAPVAGSGKSKLAEIVLGCGLLGRPLPATQIGVREEEREKRIASAMIAGDSVIHLDNLREFIDSAALASLLTCSVYQGRELGHSRMLSLPNDATVIGSGNNVHATDEISRRVVPIMLQPTTESPENRKDYRHPMLRAYVEGQIDRTRGAVFGLVQAWRAAGRPIGTVAVGSFERWAATVGGIMACAGYPEWCTNLSAWRGAADDSSAELRAFVKLWAEAYGSEWTETTSLFNIADQNDLFERKLSQTTERGRRTSFGQRVLGGNANRVVGPWRIEIAGDGKRRRARLAPS